MYKIDITEYLGIPYKHLGRDRNGLDCWGYIKLVYKEKRGIVLFDILDYPEDWSWKGRNHFIENYQNQFVQVKKPEPYDIILLKNGKDVANHAGLMCSSKVFTHCIRSGVVRSRISDEIWRKRIVGYYRYRGSNDNG